MNPFRRIGFTLIEMLVVISIIGLLISIIIPSLQSARAQARKIVCQAQLKDIRDGLWAYSVQNDGRVPFVVSPITNGGAIGEDNLPVSGFGDQVSNDKALDPYDRELWPMSLPNALFPGKPRQAKKLFSCPGAIVGYPHKGKPFTMTYRPAAANQLGGTVVETTGVGFNYIKEHFGFLDGRMIRQRRPPEYIRDPQTPWDHIHNAYEKAFQEAVFVRDMVRNREDVLIGPHGGGINVINRRFEVEFRDQSTLQEQLQAQGATVGF